MKNKLTYKTKRRLLVALVLVLSWASWSFGIKKTISCISNCNELQTKVSASKELPEKEESLKKELMLLEARIGNEDSIGFQNRVLSAIGKYCDSTGLIIHEYSGAERQKAPGYLTETHKINLQGDYRSLVRLIQKLEATDGNGKIAGVNFFMAKNHQLRKEALNLTLFINQVTKANEDE